MAAVILPIWARRMGVYGIWLSNVTPTKVGVKFALEVEVNHFFLHSPAIFYCVRLTFCHGEVARQGKDFLAYTGAGGL